MLTRNLLLGATLAATIGGTAQAAVQVLTLENPGLTVFQQTTNNPCVIGDPSCNNGAFPMTTIPANTANYDLFSPLYTAGQIAGVIGAATFSMGIDVNSTTQPLATEHLQAFDMLVGGVLAAQFIAPAPGTNLFDQQQGNGFSDELLKGFDLTGVAAGTSVQFRAIVNTATDGREEFFLISAGAKPVAEPATLALLGVGLLGLGLVRGRTSKGVSA